MIEVNLNTSENLNLVAKTDPLLVNNFINYKREDFYAALKEYGQEVTKGYEFFRVEGRDEFGHFTGSGLCIVASRILKYGLQKEFGFDNQIDLVQAEVRSVNNLNGHYREREEVLEHVWLRFNDLFIDPTYKQLDCQDEEIKIGEIEKEEQIMKLLTEPEQVSHLYRNLLTPLEMECKDATGKRREILFSRYLNIINCFR